MSLLNDIMRTNSGLFAGQSFQVLDPDQQEVLKNLSPEDQETYDGLEEDWQKEDFLTSRAETGGEGDDDPDERSFKVDQYSRYSYVKDVLTQFYQSDGYSATSIGADVERFANNYFDENEGWPEPIELIKDPVINNYMQGASSGLNALMPSAFRIGDTLYTNDPDFGVAPIYRGEDPDTIPEGAGLGPADIDSLADAGYDMSSFAGKFVNPLRGVEDFTEEGILARLQAFIKPSGGGGGARQAVFDLDQLAENYETMHRQILLEEPKDARGLVAGFQSKYRAFARQGGSLDFETWALQQIRGQAKHKMLYGKKPEFMDERQWMAKYSGAAFGVGLTDARAKQELEAGLTSGASAAGFAERVSRTQGTDTGGAGFGRKLANLTNVMGVART